MHKMTNYINGQYKIKIYCTSQEQLVFNIGTLLEPNNCPIIFNIRTQINNSLDPDSNNYINEICILHKRIKRNNYIVKSLEIFYNSYITEDEFISYIEYMKNNGFSSERNNIEFINTQTNEIIYTYDFVTIEKKENKKFVKCVNKSVYTRSRIYKQ